MKLIVNEGVYEETSLSRLLWEVLKHRLHHFLRGEGWRD